MLLLDPAMQRELMKAAGQVVSWLITSGTLYTAWRVLRDAIRKRRAGTPVRKTKQRLDIAHQRDRAEYSLDVAVAMIHTLREQLLARGVPLTDLPPWPPRADTGPVHIPEGAS